MSKRSPIDLPASVRQRLFNIAKSQGQELQAVLTQYGVERLLYRLQHASVAERFVLKGAVLFYLWDPATHRPTRDVDFLGFGDSSLEALTTAFRTVCETVVEPDGLTFLPNSVVAESIREQQEYGGIRVSLIAMLGKARIPLQIDVGFGDAITPTADLATFPTLLEFPAPRVRVYPAETVVAEKVHAMVALGIANTRMKDFYDVWTLAGTQTFDGAMLAAAITATFARRNTRIPDVPPLALSEEFSADAAKQTQWRAFLNRVKLRDVPTDLTAVVNRVATFALPPVLAASRREPFNQTWMPSTAWRPPDDER